MTTLELDGVDIPLPEGTDLAITYQAKDIRNMAASSGSYAESMEFPETHLIKRVTGNSQLVTSATVEPYRVIPARIKHEGNPVLTGTAAHTHAGSTFTIDVDGQNADLFALVKGKKLSDIDLSDLDHVWNNNTVGTSNSHDPERGYLYPLINYGKFTARELSRGNVRFDELYPAVYVRTLLERMVYPYQLTGTLLLDPKFNRLVVPFTNKVFQYRESYRVQWDAVALTNQSEAYPLFKTLIKFHQTEGDPNGQFNPNREYTVPFKGNYKADLRVKLNTTIPNDGQNATSDIILEVTRAGVIIASEVVEMKTGNNQDATISVDLPNLRGGDTISCKFWPAFNATTATILPGSSFNVTLVNEVFPDNQVHLDANLPDMAQEDFLLAIFNMFNILTQANPTTHTARLDSLERLRWEKPVDWSKKIDWSSKPEYSFAFSNYGQVNYFSYAGNEATDQNGNELLDRMSLNVSNERLAPETEAFTSAFTFTQMLPAFQGNTVLPYIPLFKQDVQKFSQYDPARNYQAEDWVWWNNDFWVSLRANTGVFPGPTTAADWQKTTRERVFPNLEAKPRLLLVEDRPLTVHVGEDYQHASTYALNTYGTFAGLSFAELREQYHNMTASMLTLTRITSLRVRLKLPDISMLDFLRPVVLNVPSRNLQGVFYLNTVSQWNPDSPGSTAVELVRLYGMALPASEETGNVTKEFSAEFSAEFN